MAEGIPGQSLSGKIVRNTFFNMLGRCWGFLIALVLTPYVVSRLGLERFGIWAIVGAVTGYFGLLDLGISSSYVKYIAEFHSRREYGKIDELISTGMAFYTLFSVAILILSFASIGPVFSFFRISSASWNEIRFVFIVSMAIFCVSNTLGGYGAVITGLQRMDIQNTLALVFSLLTAAGTVFFLERGWGLRGLVVNNAIVAVVGAAVNVVIARKLLPQMAVSVKAVNRRMFQELFGYGVRMQVARLESVFTFQADKLIIARFFPMGAVSMYQLGSTVVMKARELPLLLISALLPAVSELDAVHDTLRLRELYQRGTKYLVLTVMPLMVFLFFNAGAVMFAWMGLGYEDAALIIRILCPCYLINVMTGVGSALAAGSGKPGLLTRAALAQFCGNVILSVILVRLVGFTGVAIATLVSLSLSSIWFTVMTNRILGIRLSALVRATALVPLACALGVNFLIFSLNGMAGLYYFSCKRVVIAGILVSEMAAMAAVYAVILNLAGYFDGYDREIFARYVKKAGCGCAAFAASLRVIIGRPAHGR